MSHFLKKLQKLMGGTTSKEEPNKLETNEEDKKGLESFVVVDVDSDDKLGDKFSFSEFESEDPVSERSEEECPDPVAPISRPPAQPQRVPYFTPMPSIVEESLSSIPSSPPRTHTRSPSGDSQPLITVTDSSAHSSLNALSRDLSRRTTPESPLSELSRASSLDSRTRERLERNLEEMVDNSIGSGRSLELRSDLESFKYPSSSNSDCGSGRLPSEGFQFDAVSSSTFQGSPAEGVILEFSRLLRDGGLTVAIEFLRRFMDRDVDQEVSRVLLHEACAPATIVQDFSLILGNFKGMINHQIESPNGYTPLHVACSYLPMPGTANKHWLKVQQKEKIQKLLHHGCDCTLSDKDGETPLHLATFHSNAECVQLILRSCPRCIDMTNNIGNTALHIASRDGLLDVVCVLLEHGAKAGLLNKTNKQRSPLHQAVVNGHLNVVEALIRYDPKLVECADGVKQMLPLHLALRKHKKRYYPEIAMKLLSQRNCPVTSTDVDGRTPLHYACEWGHSELVGSLLKRDSSSQYLNTTDSNGDTALHLAYRSGNFEVVTLLKSKKAFKKIVNKAGETPKQAAINAGHAIPSKRRSLSRLFKGKTDEHVRKMSSTDSLLSSTSSATTQLSRESTI